MGIRGWGRMFTQIVYTSRGRVASGRWGVGGDAGGCWAAWDPEADWHGCRRMLAMTARQSTPSVHALLAVPAPLAGMWFDPDPFDKLRTG